MPFPSKSWWRLSGLNSPSPPFGALSASECYLRASVGGANKIPIAGTASSTFSSDVIANLWDGNTGTIWSGVGGDDTNAFLIFQYSSPFSAAELFMQPRQDGFTTQTPQNGKLDWSDDGTTWTNVVSSFSFASFTTGASQVIDFVTGPPDIRALQFAAQISVTQIPNVRALQMAAQFSVSPGKPRTFSPINVRSKGPLTLFTDMPAAGKR